MAVQLTGVVPRGNVLPELGVQTIVVFVLSEAVTSESKPTIAPAELVASVSGILAGTEIVGGVKSTTEIVMSALDWFSAVSMAVQLTRVSPNGNCVVTSPSTTSGELQDTVTTGSSSVTLMPAGTVPGVFTNAPFGDVAS